MIDKWQQREAKIGRTNIGRLMDKTSDGQLKSVHSRDLKHLITVCTVRIQSQNIPESWCSLLKAKLENTSFMLFFCSKSRCWLLLELVLGIFLASIPALVSSSLFCHVNNSKTDKTSFHIPKMCPTGFKTFNGSKSFDVKWYTFLNIFSICICFQIV